MVVSVHLQDLEGGGTQPWAGGGRLATRAVLRMEEGDLALTVSDGPL